LEIGRYTERGRLSVSPTEKLYLKEKDRRMRARENTEI
jgi:hypothetical protein